MNNILKIFPILFILCPVLFACAQPAVEQETATASFTTGNLVITPVEVYPGDTVTISLNALNTGEKAGSYTAELKINGTTETAQTITVEGNASKQVTFTITREEPGEYTISVNSIEGKFTVLARELPSRTVVLTDEQFNRIAYIVTGNVQYSYILHFLDNNKMQVTSAINFDFGIDVCDGQLCFLDVELLPWHNIFESGKEYLSYDNT
jgi:uncharacterized membrane protein